MEALTAPLCSGPTTNFLSHVLHLFGLFPHHRPLKVCLYVSAPSSSALSSGSLFSLTAPFSALWASHSTFHTQGFHPLPGCFSKFSSTPPNLYLSNGHLSLNLCQYLLLPFLNFSAPQTGWASWVTCKIGYPSFGKQLLSELTSAG